MKQFNCKIEPANTTLPAGGYIAEIKAATVKKTSGNKEYLSILFDIESGEYKDHFRRKYEASTDENKRWKGEFRLWIPTEGDQYFESTSKKFGNALYAVEESNKPEYHWDWNEAGLKGKLVGVLFRECEYSIEGRQGVTTECCAFIPALDVQRGRFSIPTKRERPKQSADFFDNPKTVEPNDASLPF